MHQITPALLQHQVHIHRPLLVASLANHCPTTATQALIHASHSHITRKRLQRIRLNVLSRRNRRLCGLFKHRRLLTEDRVTADEKPCVLTDRVDRLEKALHCVEKREDEGEETTTFGAEDAVELEQGLAEVLDEPGDVDDHVAVGVGRRGRVEAEAAKHAQEEVDEEVEFGLVEAGGE